MKKNFTFGILIVSALIICFGGLIYAQVPGTLYGTTGSSSNELITIDPSTGTGTLVTPISGTLGGVTEIEFRDDEVLFGTVGGGLLEVVTIDPLTGVATVIGLHSPFAAVAGLDFDNGGNLLGALYEPSVTTDLVTIDQTTGASTVVGTMFPGGVDRVPGLTFDTGGTLYGVVHQAGPSSLYTINPTTGVPTLVGPIGFDKVGAIEFGPDGILYGGVGSNVTNAGALISIDPSTGAGTLIGPTGFLAISGLSFFPGSTGFFDDFDSYTAGVQLVAQNNVDWDTWSGGGGTAEDPFVSNAFSYSGSNSVVEIPGNDFIRRHGDKTTGKWYMSFLFYIQAANSGYFNTMNDFDGSFVWGMDCFFDVGGTGRVDTTGGGGGGANNVPFTWTVDLWNQAMVVVDLDATPPLAEFWIGTSDPLTLVATWDFTQGGTKPTQLAVNDFFGGAPTDEMYIENYYFGDVMPLIIPVELTSFAASVNDNAVTLNWTTATELNNQGFDVERNSGNGFEKIGYVAGFGTSSEIHTYSYIDGSLQEGSYTYRLKQVDYDGTFEYSDVVEADVTVPDVFSLDQNYPNPFNPSTTINFSLAADSKVSLTVFDILGQEVANLINGNVAAGSHEINFNASNVNSGVYFYRIDATGVDGTNFTSVKKMILTK